MINFILGKLVNGLLALRYRVRITGLDTIKAQGGRGILFLPNHPALIEPVILAATLNTHLKVRVLGDEEQLQRPVVRTLARRMDALPIPSLTQSGVKSADRVRQVIDRCAAALRQGDNLILYPAGRVYRSPLEEIGANSAVERILQVLPEVRVVLVRSSGFWGSAFSWGQGRRPRVESVLWRGSGILLANGLFFGPRRHIHIAFVEPDDLPRQGTRQAINRYLESFYNQDAPPAHYVPYTWWDRGGDRGSVQASDEHASESDVTVSPVLRKQVLDFLQERTGVTEIHEEMSLTRDLGMDSLAGAELVSWLEAEYGQTEMPIDSLHRVRDVLLAAQGEAVVVGEEEVYGAPRRWLSQGPAPQCPEQLGECTITEVFLYQARRAPNRVVIADTLTGIRTYRDMILAIGLLRRELESLPGPYLGIMLPASAGVAILYLAALFAGKIPVMVNWTLGKRNLTHALDSLDVTCVVTARTLLTKLGAQGVDLGDSLDRFLCVEDLRDRFSVWDKLRAKGAAYGTWQSLATVTPPATAAVLFTSGSENVPKAVPLTHRNILTNVQDAFNCLTLTEHDSLLGVLPPFHSFGLTVSLVLPLTLGVRIFYYPNPMHGGVLGRLIDAYQLSVLVGTPTFLHGIVRVTSARRLQPLRLVVSGAEKCPTRVYALLAERCPTVKVMEGYGVTECAPVVSVNRQWQIRHGTIGKPLAAVQHAIVDVASTQRVVLGSQGLLLVRGDSIFDGYLNYEGPSPFTTFEGERWYNTGDLVCEDEEGVLTFCGRLRRFIKAGGEMISLPAIESVLQQHFDDPEVDGPALAVVATPREENPAIVLFSVRGITREAANQTLREAGLSGLHFVRQVRSIESLPLLGTGKTDYQALAALLP